MGRKESESFWESFQYPHQNVKRSDRNRNEISLTDARKYSYLGFQEDGMVISMTQGKLQPKETILDHCNDLNHNFSLFRNLKNRHHKAKEMLRGTP